MNDNKTTGVNKGNNEANEPTKCWKQMKEMTKWTNEWTKRPKKNGQAKQQKQRSLDLTPSFWYIYRMAPTPRPWIIYTRCGLETLYGSYAHAILVERFYGSVQVNLWKFYWAAAQGRCKNSLKLTVKLRQGPFFIKHSLWEPFYPSLFHEKGEYTINVCFVETLEMCVKMVVLRRHRPTCLCEIILVQKVLCDHCYAK